MNIQTFNAVMKAALLSAGKKDIRYYLNSVLLDTVESGMTHIISTDGHRMLVVKQLETGLPVGQFIIPREFLESAVKAFSCKHTYDLDITLTDTTIVISGNGNSQLGTLIDVEYPDWQRVIPTLDEPANGIGMNADYVGDAMKAAKLLGKRGNPVVTFTSSGNNSAMRYDIVPGADYMLEEAFIIIVPC